MLRSFRRSLLPLLALLLAAPLALAQDAPRIGALIKNESNPFFLTMRDGYEFAAERYGLDIVVGSTPTENAADEQLAILETWLNEGTFDAFIVTPFRATSLNSALARASEAGIPIINIDELIPADAAADSGVDIAARIASNNVRAGQLAAQLFLERLPEGAQVAVIEGAPGTTSSIDRVTGFTEAAEAGGLEVVASQPANWDRAEAFNVATNVLQGNPDVQGIFAANDGMGLGAVDAVEAAGAADGVIVASVDAIPEALDAVREGRLAGTVAQFPDEMAVLAVEAMRKVLEGRPVAPEIESPVVMISADNVDTAGSRLGDPAVGDLRIGALTKNLSNPFFLAMEEGYGRAAEDLGIEVVVGSTPTENAADEQLAILETWLNEGGWDGLSVTPFRATSLNSGLARATEAGIPVVNIDELIPADAAADSGLDIAARIASNNVRAGQFAAEEVLARVAEGAQVAVIEGAPGTTSSIDRVTGFTETAEAGGLEVVASQPANWDRAEAFNVATNILQGNPEVVAIFAANDGMGLGAVEAVEAAGLAGEVIVLSVDAIPEALDAVREGRLAGTVAQFPDEMAILAVEAMRKVLEGRPVAPEIESPVVMISADNVDTAGSRLGDPAVGDLRIGALTKNLSNPFFLAMEEGYGRAAEDLGIEVVVGSTPTENAADEQLAILETWLNEGGWDGLSVTPFRATSLNSGLARATEAGIPIVNIDELIPADAAADSGLDIASRIASNNVRAGQFAAEEVLSRVAEGAQVAVIEGAPGTTSSIDRVTGFTETAEAGGLEVVASQPANWDRAEAFNVATNILQGNPEVVAIFAANDGMGLGAVEAVEAAGLAGEVIVLSVDAIPEALDAVREGRLVGTVAQFPDEMAILAVEALVKLAEGRPVAPEMESPVLLITQETLP